MALTKPVRLPTGVVAEYWIITGAQDYYQESLSDVTLAGFLSEAAAQSSPIPAPLTTRLIRVALAPELDPPPVDLRGPHYAALARYLADNPDDPLAGAEPDGRMP